MNGVTSTVGKAKARKDAWNKVTGAAIYAADIAMVDVYHGMLVRSPYHAARIRRINGEPARQVPGVAAVLTIDDVPGSKSFGYLEIQDQPPLADGVTRHMGEPVALVIGESKAAARLGCTLVEVEYEKLAPVFDPELAAADGAPLVHEDGNIVASYDIKEGDVEAAFAAAETILDEQFSVPRIHPGYIEPENALARWNDDGTVRVFVSSQQPFSDQLQIAQVLGLAEENVRVKSAVIGGGFGGKEDSSLAILAALGAQAVRGAVRIVNNRRESFLAHPKRHAVKIRYRLGAKNDGTLLALQVKAYLDTGAYHSFGSAVGAIVTETVGGLYRIPNVDLEVHVVYTNSPYCGAMRGFGTPQAVFAVESMMDRLAERLGIDPIDLREANIFRPGDKSYTGMPLHETAASLKTCLENGREARERLQKIGPASGKLSGVGMALGLQPMGFPDDSSHRLEWLPDGKVRLYLGAPDIGQGLATAAELVTAEELGLPYEQIETVAVDTAISPMGGPTCASRMTYMTGNALIEAASMLKKQLLELAARMMDLSPQQLTYEQGMVILPNGDKVGAVEFVSRAAEEGRPIKAEGTYSFPNPKTIIPQFLPLGVHQILFTVACQVARVEVDPELGTVEITDLVAIHDVGRMISKSAVEGQIDGGVLTGIGYALYEEMTLKEDGQWVDSFSEYLLPTSQDLPRNYERIILEIPEESGPYGAKGVGEITLVPTAPAIAAAVHEAVGVRINKLPIKPSDLVQA